MSIKDFKNAYMECAFWLLDEEYKDGDDTLHESAEETIDVECRDFYNLAEELWTEGGWSDEQAGHDFFLTRNHHGAGFWDRHWNDNSEEIGRKLTEFARPYGEQDLYRGDDGLLYV